MKKSVSGTVILIFAGMLWLNTGPVYGQPGFSDLLQAARGGDVEAMCDTALAYFYGKGILKDPFKAKCWAKKAYDEGSKRAEKIWNDLELWQYSGTCQGFFDDTPLPKYRTGAHYTEPYTGMQFRYIPKGCYIMGCHANGVKCKKDEKPAHRVCLDGFWMGRFEVTQAQWQQIMGSNPSWGAGSPDLPVENVTYKEVRAFVQKLNTKISGKASLPTEAQWEYACRNAGEPVNYPWEEDLPEHVANCGACGVGESAGKTVPVGSFPPNESGLYDMGGNVKEWCRDVYDKKAYANHKRHNPVYLEKGSSRVVRGGSFSDNLRHLRCTARGKSLAGIRSDGIGFRLVLERQE